MLLGRRTFEEMAGWFTDQRPIVLSRQPDYRPPGEFPPQTCVASTIGAALSEARARGESDLLVAGGAQIYGLALPFADELLLTEVHVALAGVAHFPNFSPEDWEEISREHFAPDAENRHPMSFVTYRRR
jgi:dihydrofolate reductase